MVNTNKKDNKEKLIFGFDVGLGSLGVAVRKGDDIVEAHSYIIDPDVGRTKDEADRRRSHRTKKAHKQREQWLEKVWKENVGEESLLRGIQIKKTTNKNGKKVFKASKGDERLEREFPKKGDNTVYNSALLRIMLIEGKKLEHWQIYKALRSAIQRRDYDEDVPWKSNVDNKKKQIADEKKETLKEWNMSEKDINKENPIKDEKFQLPCYYDALRMGLWDFKTKKIIKIRQDINAQKARHYTTLFINRENVRRELELLLKNAEKQIPALKGKTDYILYGDGADPKKREYKDIDKQPEYSFATKRQGVLAQKYPRFDNRCVNRCSQIIRPKNKFQFKVCRKTDPLYIKVNFLLQLNNVRYSITDKSVNEYLHPGYIRYILEKRQKVYIKSLEKHQLPKKPTQQKNEYQQKRQEELLKSFYISKNDLKKYIQEKLSDDTVKQSDIDVSSVQINKASIGGRCAYSRPALKLIYEMFLSEKTPQEFYDEIKDSLDTDQRFKKYNLQKKDIEFLLNIDNEGRFYPYDSNLIKEDHDKKYDTEQQNDSNLIKEDHDKKYDTEQQIKFLIASCRDSIVRHRLTFLLKTIKDLMGVHGEPTEVVFEFAREEKNDIYRKNINKDNNAFKQKRKDLYKTRRDKNESKNKEVRKLLKEKGAPINPSKQYFEKAKLLIDQNYRCLYTNDTLCFSELDTYDIDHIVPRRGGYNGPDAYWNKVLVSPKVNRQDKENKLPLEYLQGGDRIEFIRRISEWNDESVAPGIKKIPPKKNILLCKDKKHAQELVEQYRPLAITGWIARLSRDLVCLKFGWKIGEKDKKPNVHIIKGGWTAKTRSDYDIDEILYDEEYVKEYNETERKKKGKLYKNRDDQRHHALDAMLITYFTASEFANSEKKNIQQETNKFYFPQSVQKMGPKNYFESKLLNKNIIPTIEGHLMPELRHRVKPALIERPSGIRNRSIDKMKCDRCKCMHRLPGNRIKNIDEQSKEKVIVQRKDLYEAITTRTGKDRKLKSDGHIKIFDECIKKSFLKFKEQHSLKKGDQVTLEQKNELVKFIKKDLRLKTDIKKVLYVIGEDVTQYKDLKKDNSDNPILGYQVFNNKKEESKGARKKGIFICKCKKDSKYKIVPVHSFDNTLEKKGSLEASGYTIEFDGRVIQNGSIFKTDKGNLSLEKSLTKGSMYLKSYNNQYISKNGFEEGLSNGKPKKVSISVDDFMSLNPKLISTPR